MKEIPNYRLATFLHSNASIPWDYRELVQGWIYESLKTPLGEKIHDDKYSLFSFSLIPMQPCADEKGLSSKTGLWIFRLASAYEEMLTTISSKLKQGSTLNIGNQKLTVVETIQEVLSNNSILEARPIVVVDIVTKKMLTPAEDNFSKFIIRGLEKKWEFCFRQEKSLPQVKFNYAEPPYSRLAFYRGRRLLCYGGAVRLETSPEMLRLIQCAGIGMKSPCGFGMAL